MSDIMRSGVGTLNSNDSIQTRSPVQHPHVVVVVPYFQRSPGPLLKALQSIAAQADFGGHLEVLIVDDESPVSAEAEVAAAGDIGLRITVLHQRNRGPAGARNRALDAIPASADYIAFLDSDDEWNPIHLSNAIAALESGYDFYFANFFQIGQSVGAIERTGKLTLDDHPLMAIGKGVRRFAGDLFHQTIVGNVIGTPTVVIRWHPFRDLRFREQFVFAGEDYLFWMDCAHRTKRVAFGSYPEVVCGRGVNMFSGSGWGTPKSLDRIVDEAGFKKFLLSAYKLTDTQKAHVRQGLKTLRRSFAQDVFHRLRTRSPIRPSLLIRQLRTDPASYLEFGFVPLRKLMGKDS